MNPAIALSVSIFALVFSSSSFALQIWWHHRATGEWWPKVK
jgi:hypothetical protein